MLILGSSGMMLDPFRRRTIVRVVLRTIDPSTPVILLVQGSAFLRDVEVEVIQNERTNERT